MLRICHDHCFDLAVLVTATPLSFQESYAALIETPFLQPTIHQLKRSFVPFASDTWKSNRCPIYASLRVARAMKLSSFLSLKPPRKPKRSPTYCVEEDRATEGFKMVPRGLLSPDFSHTKTYISLGSILGFRPFAPLADGSLNSPFPTMVNLSKKQCSALIL